MSRFQDAVLWWNVMFQGLGSGASKETPGPAGLAARDRVNGLRHLYFALLADQPIDSLLEIGAHNAETSRRFVGMAPHNRAFAYEAAREVYDRVSAAPLPDRLEYVHCAVGAQNGEAPFFLPVEERLHGWGSLRRRDTGRPMTTQTVPMLTLATLGERHGAGRSDRNFALWIDVEGAALEVLGGGLDFLQDRVAMIFAEINDIPIYEGSATSLEIFATLLERGFVPVARDNEYSNAWNLLVVHETTFQQARSLIAQYLYRMALPTPVPPT